MSDKDKKRMMNVPAKSPAGNYSQKEKEILAGLERKHGIEWVKKNGAMTIAQMRIMGDV